MQIDSLLQVFAGKNGGKELISYIEECNRISVDRKGAFLKKGSYRKILKARLSLQIYFAFICFRTTEYIWLVIAFPDLMTYSYIKKNEPQNKFGLKIRPQNKFGTIIICT